MITQPTGNQQFVSIDGKRTYFNLHPNTATGISSVPTQAVALPKPVAKNPTIGVGTVGEPIPLIPRPGGNNLFASNDNTNTKKPPNRAVVSTALSIKDGNSGSPSTSGSVTVDRGTLYL